MKFWQLVGVVNGDMELITRVALMHSDWQKYEPLVKDFSNLVKTQDRVKLDTALDSEFVIAVLNEIRGDCYLSHDGWLRSWQVALDDRRLSFVDTFERYGGEILEEVCEKGSVQVA